LPSLYLTKPRIRQESLARDVEAFHLLVRNDDALSCSIGWSPTKMVDFDEEIEFVRTSSRRPARKGFGDRVRRLGIETVLK
jgi:hypothetical protein